MLFIKLYHHQNTIVNIELSIGLDELSEIQEIYIFFYI